MSYIFQDRQEAGKKLAEALSKYKGLKDALILALPRGGVPVAAQVAQTLKLPLDVLLVRKLGTPGHEELAMGAIASGNICFINKHIVEQLNISQATIDTIAKEEKKELLRRDALYRNKLPFPQLKNQTIIVIDDGLATGATMKAAILALRQAKAKYTIIAVPLGATSTCKELKQIADKVICLNTPEPFYSVSQGYVEFPQTTDKEVQEILETYREKHKYK